MMRMGLRQFSAVPGRRLRVRAGSNKPRLCLRCASGLPPVFSLVDASYYLGRDRRHTRSINRLLRMIDGRNCPSARRHDAEGAPWRRCGSRVSLMEKDFIMPKAIALRRARRYARQGKKPNTQAGEFVREEMKAYEHGSGNVRSRRQAIAIGLSEARRAGVKLGVPPRGKTSAANRRKAKRDLAVGSGRHKPSPARSRGAKHAARTRARRYARS